MLTSDIETYADIGGLSSPDLNLKVILRRNVVPAFLADCSYTSWRRKVATLALIQGDKQKDLPDDFWQMQVVSLSSDLTKELLYIGEDPNRVIIAEANTTQGKPSGYYFAPRVTSALLKSIKFTSPADTAYTVYYCYYTGVAFTDDTTAVEMDKYIPNQYQWALVEALKAQIMFLRFGIGDPRYVAAEQSYGTWVQRATDNPELARRNHAVFAR